MDEKKTYYNLKENDVLYDLYDLSVYFYSLFSVNLFKDIKL